MGGRLLIPNSVTFDETCINKIKKSLCDYILKNNHHYSEDGFIIYIKINCLKIWYNHHYYYVIIIKEKNKYYWHLRPYQKSFYTTPSKDINSFEFIILAIKEHDKLLKEKPHP